MVAVPLADIDIVLLSSDIPVIVLPDEATDSIVYPCVLNSLTISSNDEALELLPYLFISPLKYAKFACSSNP